jgi:hypothetical protein
VHHSTLPLALQEAREQIKTAVSALRQPYEAAIAAGASRAFASLHLAMGGAEAAIKQLVEHVESGGVSFPALPEVPLATRKLMVNPALHQEATLIGNMVRCARQHLKPAEVTPFLARHAGRSRGSGTAEHLEPTDATENFSIAQLAPERRRVTPGKIRPFDPPPCMPHAGEVRELLTAVAVDDPERPSKITEHRVDVERTHYTSAGARYTVTFLGEMLVEGARTPLFDACRALLARGITGTVEMYSPGSSVPRMKVDIEEGAQLTVSEGDKAGPRLARYRVHPGSGGEEDEQ